MVFQLKFEMNTEPRKKFHMINRLRKAQKESEKLEKLVMAVEQVKIKLAFQMIRVSFCFTNFSESNDFLQLMNDCIFQCDARTKLEVQAYHQWISGTLFFELQDWASAMASLTTAKTIYEKLSSTLSEEEGALYRARMNEIVPSLRFCAYNSGDEAAKQDLMNLRGGGQVDELLSQVKNVHFFVISIVFVAI